MEHADQDLLKCKALLNAKHDEALIDYAMTVRNLCWQYQNGLWGDSASFFFKEVINKDVKKVFGFDLNERSESVQQAMEEMKKAYEEIFE